MFFKRANRDKPSSPAQPAPVNFELARGSAQAEPDPAADVEAPAADPTVAVPVRPEFKADAGLPARELRRRVDPSTLGFDTTDELDPVSGLIGQTRALKAIAFGVGLKAPDFNIFVCGPPASGRRTAVKAHLHQATKTSAAPADWVYVHNFEQPGQPTAISLPRGRAPVLARGMVAVIDELKVALPGLFEGHDYQARRRAIDEEFRGAHDDGIEALNRRAAQQNIAILRTPMGFAMAPMHEGKVVKPEVFAGLPERLRKDVEAKIQDLQKELELLLTQAPRAERLSRQKLAELDQEFARRVLRAAFDDIEVAHGDLPRVLAFLAAAEGDLLHNIRLFASPSAEAGIAPAGSFDTVRDPRFRRYMVNVLVTGATEDQGAPVVAEDNPSHGNLIGRVEHVAHMGAMLTDFLLVKPGALHRANGGALLIDARKLLSAPFAWDALKRALKSGQIRIDSPADALGIQSTQSLDPEPIPLDVKVVLFGERTLYHELAALDPEFQRLFKVQADFDDSIERSAENELAYARLIASIVASHKLKPVDREGAARLIEEGARLAADREKLSIEIGRLADIVREADYWAGQAGRKAITRADVQRALDEHILRSNRLDDRSRESIGRGIVLVDTAGEKTGQINGLSVIAHGGFAFGRPSRITARVRMGSGRVTDIEREAKLGGALHSKGVMILWGFLAGRYAHNMPLALAATLVFEQSYGAVDGDSASLAELYTLLSALADVPLNQGIAVTGAVNQWGEVQAVGGVNEKIEGFFDICKARGLDGKQGVLIPQSNVQHLMLREDVVEAVEAGEFSVHAVETVDAGLGVLTGRIAGGRGADGLFATGSVNRLVEDKLLHFADRAGRYGVGVRDDGTEQVTS